MLEMKRITTYYTNKRWARSMPSTTHRKSMLDVRI
jgi:hypothetical protein